MTEPLLQVTGLHKSFGSLRVTDDVSFDLRQGECHAVIGPNGAGKTTLINQISGILNSEAGRIAFSGRDITALPMHARVRLGLVRSFQIVSLLGGLSTLENVALAVQARSGSSFRFFANVAREADINSEANGYLEYCGLASSAEKLAGTLSHGQKRQLELAIGLASKPKLFVLDEPLAGTGHEEAQQIIEILRNLKRTISILLIEHDMEAIFALADRITVLVNGRVIATGSPADVRANKDVQIAYLGQESGAMTDAPC
jgi:branched-chain amino acid transport system ATP-binding protein